MSNTDQKPTLEQLQVSQAEIERLLLESVPGLEQRFGRDMALALLTARPAGEVFGIKIFTSNYAGKNDVLWVDEKNSRITRMRIDPFKISEVPPPATAQNTAAQSDRKADSEPSGNS